MTHIRKILPIAFIIFFTASCQNDTDNKKETEYSDAFSFAFMTDIHLNFRAEESYLGFKEAIEKARYMGAEFIITGGDNVDADVVGDDEKSARAMYERFSEIIEQSGIDFHVTIGNHDRFWHLENSLITHGTSLFKEFFPDTYYTYECKNVKFIHLNTSEVCEDKYCVSEIQKDWLHEILDNTNESTPIVLVVHVPFLSFYYPALYGYYTNTDTFENFKEIWQMFENHNLQLVLQGHMHLYEELNVLNTQFLTGGALSGRWWAGPYHGTKEGFILINWDGHDFSWDYIDYGWQAKN